MEYTHEIYARVIGDMPYFGYVLNHVWGQHIQSDSEFDFHFSNPKSWRLLRSNISSKPDEKFSIEPTPDDEGLLLIQATSKTYLDKATQFLIDSGAIELVTKGV